MFPEVGTWRSSVEAAKSALMQAFPLGGFYWIVFGAGLLLASVLDLYKRRLPNWLTMALLAAGLTVRLLHAGFWAFALGLLGALIAALLLILPFARGWLGGGDVKLFAAVGAWLGPRWVLEAALVAAVAGGVLSIFFLLRAPPAVRRDMVRNLKLSAIEMTIVAGERRPHRLSPPYAPAIAAGAAWTVWAHAAALLH